MVTLTKVQQYFTLATVFRLVCMHDNNDHWIRYLEQKNHYVGHFSEMLRMKNEQYHSKREEYSNLLVNYRETERENHHHHDEEEDELTEKFHEHKEYNHELQHDHHHHGDRIRKFTIPRREPKNIIATSQQALQFFKRKRWR